MTTIYRRYCPLKDCSWFHDDAGPDPFTMVSPEYAAEIPVPGSIEDYVRAACLEHAAAENETVRKHLTDDHELIEWVLALTQAQAEARAARQALEERDNPEPARELATLAGPADPLTPWPTAPIFDAAVLAQFRVASRYERAFEFAHIGGCGFSAIGAARRLDLLCSTATAHAAICDGTGPYPRVIDPDPWTRDAQ